MALNICPELEARISLEQPRPIPDRRFSSAVRENFVIDDEYAADDLTIDAGLPNDFTDDADDFGALVYSSSSEQENEDTPVSINELDSASGPQLLPENVHNQSKGNGPTSAISTGTYDFKSILQSFYSHFIFNFFC